MLTLLKKIVGTKNDRELKKLWPIVHRVNELEAELQALSPEALREKTTEFRSRLAEGETLDDLLPEAFAAVREASRRTTGMRHFDVQLLGGMVLHQGKIAEMKTGEGKTLVATSALYLNALEGKGTHLVTVNDYLARRDVQWMGPIYHALGMTTASIIHDASYLYDPTFLTKDYRFQSLRPIDRKAAYRADITYGTNNEFGFDYLRDNMKFSLDEYVQRELHFAIVDEVDNILVDEARTPLIISGPAEVSTDRYYGVNRIIPRLQKDADYTIDEKHKQVLLTDEGVAKVERILGISNLYDPTEIDTLHHVVQALRAHVLFKRDVDYVVKDGQVLIVDEFTGRLMPGRRWSDGLHQAVEAKEGVKIERENQTLATITIQNYFRMYGKLAGMTGTADTEAVEFKKIYKLDVMVMPPNRPMQRKDHPDVVYRTEREKFDAVIEEVADCAERGQPVLVGTISVEKSERLSKLLKKKGIRHHVLNAVNHELEASIIAQAGRHQAVTIATNMAGRGTDILLGGNPEFLARAEMENEWIQRVAKATNPNAAPAKRYEETLRDLRERYEEEVEKTRRHYEPLLQEQDEKRRDALRDETESRKRLFDSSPLRAARERYERLAAAELIPALGDGRNVSDSYLRAKTEFESVLLDASGGVAEPLRQEFETVRHSLSEMLEQWSDLARRNGGGLADRVNSARVHYDRIREDLEFSVLRGGAPGAIDVAAAYGKAAEARRQAEEAHRAIEVPFEMALAEAYRRYEDERQTYVKAIDQIRLQLDSAPQEFEARFAEILAGYKTLCAEEREKVVEAGGLHILGTERHESRRIDNQLRGRAGRQGDPGSSRFYLSLEDDLMRIFGADRIQGLMQKLGMEEGVPIEHGLINRAVSNAQSKVEGHNFDIRKHLLEYDDVMNKQREVVYHRRRSILAGEGLREDVLDMAEGVAETLIATSIDAEKAPDEWDWKAIEDAVLRQFNVRLELGQEEREQATVEDLVERTVEGFRTLYAEKEQRFTSPILAQLEKIIMLQTLDQLWKDHLLTMDHLKEGIGLRGYGQKNPLQEYQKEGFSFFEQMISRFEIDVVQRLATVQLAATSSAEPSASGGQRVQATFESVSPAAAPELRETKDAVTPTAASEPAAAPSAEAAAPAPSPEALALLERLEQRQKADRERRRLAEGNRIAQPKSETIRREPDRVGRNDPCPCGSGKKFKKCHGA